MSTKMNNNIVADVKISFDGFEYGKSLYRTAKKNLNKTLSSKEMDELDKFMNLIEGLPSPIREDAFVSFCVKKLNKSNLQVRNAA